MLQTKLIRYPKRKKQARKQTVYKNGEEKFSRPPRPEELPEGVWTEQALKVLKERYLLKNEKLEVTETPEDMCWRVAWEIARPEIFWGKKEVLTTAKEFYRLLISREFFPNSPTLMNAGTNNNLQYSACFVIPVEDSMEGIFDALKYQALIHKSGGGTGFSFSRLRPSGAPVKTSNGTASGPVSFMRIFDAATNEVKQGGKRRGANMGILRVDHPDILEFIHCKKEGGITNFNISVAITDRFMEAYTRGENYDLVNPKNKEAIGSVSARDVFNEITKSAWETGDPGVIFLDRVNNSVSNPVPSLGPIESTNPCGEQPLYPFDSCNLGSIFLTYFTKEAGDKKEVDWRKLERVTRQAVHFLDNVIEVNPYTLPQIRQTTLAVRRIGLGVGGWADMLVDLGIPYDSQDALDLAEKVMRTIQENAVSESEKLARERGPFPLWEKSLYAKKRRRNSTVTTIAPTGSISIIAGTSSGIEPHFAVAFRHVVNDKNLNRHLTFINPKFVEIAQRQGFWTDRMRQKIEEKGVVAEIPEVPEKIRRLFATAHEITPEWHIKMQAAFQKYTENAVSKTINLPYKATVEDVANAYLLAWETGCKGVTVFRDGSKENQVLNLGLKGGEKKTTIVFTQEPLIVRPDKATGATYRLVTPLGTAFITINEDERGEPLEVFINIGKAGSDVAAMAEALGRTISMTLRFRGDLSPRERAREIVHQLCGIGGRRWVGFGPNKIRSLPDAVGVAISSHYGFGVNGISSDKGALSHGAQSAVEATGIPTSGNDDPTAVSAPSDKADIPKSAGDLCPACGASTLIFAEGCSKCHSCGHSEC